MSSEAQHVFKAPGGRIFQRCIRGSHRDGMLEIAKANRGREHNFLEQPGRYMVRRIAIEFVLSKDEAHQRRAAC
eukprot:CAMPEP_0179460744 /NCGR_PEP_ID=MMETSP0799-20121207/43691_1 /TAXON_ID=46947 /ORGANISM="Geminigera cryophila, Strain CCMP2564" /LENGTH=73 /DNA_ID=CAMNT_0021263095 /DNA_START=404 /DNA_END=625 /DNA_ORIENTATION=-